MLVKGIDECARAPDQIAAVEMILIRIAYAADLPSPEELVRVLSGNNGGSGQAEGTRQADGRRDNGAQASALTHDMVQEAAAVPQAAAFEMAAGGGQTATAAKKSPELLTEEVANPLTSFEDIADIIGREGGLMLKIAFEENVRPVRFEQGAIEIALAGEAPRGLANDIKRVLHNSTGENWVVAVSEAQGGETLAEKKQREHQQELEAVKQHPLVKAALKQFPDARITEIRAIETDDPRDPDNREENER
jgi:DNA polymerase-3 subunit gamma/tau